MSNFLHVFSDPVTVVLLSLLISLIALPGMVIVVWKVTYLPFPAGALRWLYVAWSLALGSGLVYTLTRQIRLSASDVGTDNFIQLIFLALCLGTMLLVGSQNGFAFVNAQTTGILAIFSAFALWSIITTLWAISATLTLYKACAYFIMIGLFAFAVFLIRRSSIEPHNQLLALKSLFDWNWFTVFLLLISVYVGILLWPDYALVYGVGTLGFQILGALPAISSNSVAELGAIMAIVALTRMVLRPSTTLFYFPLFGFSLVTMVLAQGRSGILAFLVAAVVVLAASRRFALLACLGLPIAVLYSVYYDAVNAFFERGQTEATLESLNGRVLYWQATWDAIQERPIGGFGAFGGGRYITQTAFGSDEVVTTVHNAYVETVAGTGIVGLSILLLGVVAAWFWLFKLRSFVTRDPVGRLLWIESIGVLSILTVRSMFSVGLIWTPILNFGVVLVFISVVRYQAVGARKKFAANVSPHAVRRTDGLIVSRNPRSGRGSHGGVNA
jgi:O-antigen ligase